MCVFCVPTSVALPRHPLHGPQGERRRPGVELLHHDEGHTHVYVCMYIYIYIYVLCAYVYIERDYVVCMYVYISLSMYIYIYIRIYIYICNIILDRLGSGKSPATRPRARASLESSEGTKGPFGKGPLVTVPEKGYGKRGTHFR